MTRALVVISAASVILLVLVVCSVDADVIANYTFPAYGNYSSSDSESHSTASDVTGGGCNIFYINDWSSPINSGPVLQIDHTDPYGTGEDWAFLYGVYFQFTVTVDPGYEMDLTSLTFDAMRAQDGGNRTWYLYSSVDGFAMGADRIDCSVITYYLGDGHGGAMEPFSVDLSAAKFQDLDNVVTFRFYYNEAWYGSSYFDNVRLNGSVAPAGVIPEPATVLLVSSGALGVIGCIRRRRTR